MTATTDASSVSDEDRTALTDTVTRFARTEIAPHVDAWDAAGEFPRSLYRRAADLGLLGLGYPEQYGGTPASYQLRMPLWRALSRHGASGGVLASLLSHNIGLPPVLAHGSDAVRMRADWITVAVRTGEAGSKGSGGISMLLMPGHSAGLSRSKLDKMGWLCSDTAHLRFDNVRVPARYLLGEEGAGFRIIMSNFNSERFGLAASALGFAEACYDEALTWARQRKTFGAALVEHQVIRHKLVDMQMRIQSTAVWCESVAAQADAGRTGPEWVANICMLKNHSTQTMQFCADHAVQILGGMGFMRGTVSERIYREVKVMMIGGGAEEIMKDLAAKQLGI